MKLFRKIEEIDTEKYLLVTYFLKSETNLLEASKAIAIGQSIGNPSIRSNWETQELIEKYSCKIISFSSTGDELFHIKKGNVIIAFPLENLNVEEDGITQLFVQIMGGQLDIDIIQTCKIMDVKYPKSFKDCFLGPKYGITGIRKYVNQYKKPLLGGIIKPKIGISPSKLLEIVKELVEGGVDFIKEDEIMSNPSCCPITERVPLIVEYLNSIESKVIYAVCINSDYPHVIDRVKQVHNLGGNAIHVNFWNGLGVYNSIRKLDLPIFLFFQKSGDKILTDKNHRFSISWRVICELAGIMGVDFIHAGMWGGYMNDNEEELKEVLRILRNKNVMPSLSCGMNKDLIKPINEKFGTDYMANCGGSIHGHKEGTLAGTKDIRSAIENFRNI